jgi:hypothetical protein
MLGHEEATDGRPAENPEITDRVADGFGQAVATMAAAASVVSS